MAEFDDLVIRAQSGSKAAMNSVIKYMYKSIYLKTSKMWQELPGGHALEDMVQFAMIEVCDAIKTYNGKGSALNWIWLHVKNEIYMQARYLNYNKRKANLNSLSFDKPLDSENDEKDTLFSIVPCRANNTENEAINNVFYGNLLETIYQELSELELMVMGYMLKEYLLKDIAIELGCKSKTVDNAKERIKGKVRKYLAAG